MKRLNIFLVLLVLALCLTGFKHNNSNRQEVKDSVQACADITSPVISFKHEEGIILPLDTALVLDEHIDIIEDESRVTVTSFGKLDIANIGSYDITILAVDSCQNASLKTAEVKVVTTEEYAEIEAQRQRQRIIDEANARIMYREEMLNYLQSNYDETLYNNAYALAQRYIGMEGQCVEIAIAYLSNYYGFYPTLSNSYQISYTDARPGDIVEYADGGHGLWHVAVYLGNGEALHGNWKGKAVIGPVIVSKATDPIFKRLY